MGINQISTIADRMSSMLASAHVNDIAERSAAMEHGSTGNDSRILNSDVQVKGAE